MGVQPFYGKGPHRLLRAGRAKIKWYTEPPTLLCTFSQFTDVASGRIIQVEGRRFGDPCSKKTQLSNVGYTIIKEVQLKTETRGTARLTALHCHV